MHRAVPLLLAVLAGAVAAIAVVSVAVSARGDVGPGTVEVSARWNRGGTTELLLPPLGRIGAPTHRAPVTVQARVERLDVDELQVLMSRPDIDDSLRAEVERDIRPLLRRYAVSALLSGAAAGLVAGVLLPRRRWTSALAGGAAGFLTVAALLGLTWRDYDPTAFERTPRFEGPLERAPAVLANVRRQVTGIDDVRSRLRVLSTEVANLYGAAAGDDGRTGRREVRILHVSDIHSNPVGLEIARRLASDFGAHAVVDTGDFTSFGIGVESRLGELVAGFPVPYYLVPGNHDSDANRATLAAMANVEVLDGDVVDIRGVTVLGVADPTFTADNVVSTEDSNAEKVRSAPAVSRLTRRLRPDVLAVHDSRQASAPRVRADVVLAGHTHERRVRDLGEALLLTVGSTGATGLGTFTVETDHAYEAQLLRFVDGELVAVDYVSLTGVHGSFRVDRQLAADLRDDP